jgi:cytochrome oxidase Cu insertion factor (SCO1/SenC/PrrC family)
MTSPRALTAPRLISSFTLCLLVGVSALLAAACTGGGGEPKKASVDSLTAPLPTATPPAVDARRTEPERVGAGSTPPDFTLEDKDGRAYTLSSYRGRKSVVLVFYRGHF